MVWIKSNHCLLQCKNNRVAEAATRRPLFADHHDDAEEFFQTCRSQNGRLQNGRLQGGQASRADAGIFPLAADVAAARARSRDAPVPSLVARSWPDRAT